MSDEVILKSVKDWQPDPAIAIWAQEYKDQLSTGWMLNPPTDKAEDHNIVPADLEKAQDALAELYPDEYGPKAAEPDPNLPEVLQEHKPRRRRKTT